MIAMTDTSAHTASSPATSVQVGEWVRVHVVYHPMEEPSEYVGRVIDYDASADQFGVSLDSAADSTVYVDPSDITNLLDDAVAASP